VSAKKSWKEMWTFGSVTSWKTQFLQAQPLSGLRDRDRGEIAQEGNPSPQPRASPLAKPS
jgi:hypothetical protein